MKRLAMILVVFIGVGVVGYRAYKSASASSIKDKLVRFHVIANSDSKEDQRVKLKVRDAVLKKVGGGLEDVNSQEESLIYLNSRLDDIEKIANDILEKEGKSYRAKAMIGEYDFPVKNYNSITLPAGKYKALRIVLGEGDGNNWWCVMFPPLCFIDITRGYTEEKTNQELKTVLTDDEIDVISNYNDNYEDKNSLKQEKTRVEFRFKSIELIESTFNSIREMFK